MPKTPHILTWDQNWNWLPQNWWSKGLKCRGAEKVAAILWTSGNPVPENTVENLSFWLFLVEKQSIEADINAGKPIMATPAYTKFLAALLPNGLKIEDEKQLLKFSRDTPEYEIHNGGIRTNYECAVNITQWLSELFGRSVRLLPEFSPVSVIQEKIGEHHHYAGLRHSYTGKSVEVYEVGYAWASRSIEKSKALTVFRRPNGRMGRGLADKRDGFSL